MSENGVHFSLVQSSVSERRNRKQTVMKKNVCMSARGSSSSAFSPIFLLLPLLPLLSQVCVDSSENS